MVEDYTVTVVVIAYISTGTTDVTTVCRMVAAIITGSLVGFVVRTALIATSMLLLPATCLQ